MCKNSQNVVFLNVVRTKNTHDVVTDITVDSNHTAVGLVGLQIVFKIIHDKWKINKINCARSMKVALIMWIPNLLGIFHSYFPVPGSRRDC